MSMIIKKLYVFSLSILIYGCTLPTAHIDNMIKVGDLVSAYRYAVIRGEKIKDRAEFVSSLKNNSKYYSTDKFYASILSDLNNSQKTEHFIIESAELISFAKTDGLINSSQAELLDLELMYLAQMESVNNPSILSSSLLRQALPDFGSPESKTKILTNKFNQLKERKNISIGQLLPFFDERLTANNGNEMQNLNSFAKEVAYKDLVSIQNTVGFVGYNQISHLLKFATIIKDDQFSKELNNILVKVQWNKKDLVNNEIKNFNREFAENELKRKSKNIRIEIDPDDIAMSEDLSKILKEKNEWINIDDKAPTTLVIKKQRFIENHGNSNNSTEIVPDPSFGTLLFIPKNASVLFDYTSTDYRIEYQLIASIKNTSDIKNIRGVETIRKIECRNFRFQNVFGGVGSIDGYPNERIANFCSSTRNIDFDYLKSKVLINVADQIKAIQYFNNAQK